MSGVNYYQLLSVRRDADPDEIRRAYVRLIKHIHPDLAGPDRRPAARLQDLQRAYRCLLDPEARRRYDADLDESNAAHVERLRRVERRLAHRRRRQPGYRRTVTARQPGLRRINWRLLLLFVAGIIVVARLKSGNASL